MLAILFPQPEEFTLIDVPEPEAGPGELVIHVKSTTICATDFKILHGRFPGVTYPHIPGHEWGGEVVQVGSGVSGFNPGDKVGVEVHVGCGMCPRCREGLYNLCENYGHPEKGHTHIGFTIPGGLSEYCAIPAQAAYVLPGNLGFDHGAFTDTVGIALWAVERGGGVRAGENVAVVGPGALGLLAAQIAHAQGARQVIVVGVKEDRQRLGLAMKMGADQIIEADGVANPVQALRDLTSGRGVDLVIEFTGSAAAAQQSIQMSRRGGRIVHGGATGPGRRLDIDLSTIVRGHLDVYGSVANPRGISNRANELMAKGSVDITPLITHHFPLSEFPLAWEIFSERQEGVIRPMLHP